jgi:SH3-like domain-containing protein
MKRLTVVTLFFTIVGIAAAQNSGGLKYVAVKSAELKSSTGFFAAIRAYLPEGEAVTVLREQNRWAEVRSSGNLSGWVAAASLSSRRIIAPGRQISAREVAMAGKGFSAELEAEYRLESRLDYSLIDSMEAEWISRETLPRFLREGRLAGGD